MINLIQATINLPKTLFYGSGYLFFTCLYKNVTITNNSLLKVKFTLTLEATRHELVYFDSY